MSGDTYLIWFDDNAKKALDLKAKEAIAAYEARFGVRPNVLLVNGPADFAIDGVNIITKPTVQKNSIWAGRDDDE